MNHLVITLFLFFGFFSSSTDKQMKNLPVIEICYDSFQYQKILKVVFWDGWIIAEHLLDPPAINESSDNPNKFILSINSRQKSGLFTPSTVSKDLKLPNLPEDAQFCYLDYDTYFSTKENKCVRQSEIPLCPL